MPYLICCYLLPLVILLNLIIKCIYNVQILQQLKVPLLCSIWILVTYKEMIYAIATWLWFKVMDHWSQLKNLFWQAFFFFALKIFKEVTIVCIMAFHSGAKNVINACRECKVRRLIYNSSADVVFDGLHDVNNGDESLRYPWKVWLFLEGFFSMCLIGDI